MASTMRFDRWEDTLGNSVNMTQVSGGSGLVPIVPSSVTVGSGSATVGANGLVTFTGTSTLSLNDVFTSTYKNYRIVMNHWGTLTSTEQTWLRLRASGSDNASAYYTDGWAGWYNNAGGSSLSASGSWSISSFSFGYTVPQSSMVVADICNPSATTPTNISYNSTALTTSANAIYNHGIMGVHNVGQAFTGFTVWPNTGAFGGTIQVYGYR